MLPDALAPAPLELVTPANRERRLLGLQRPRAELRGVGLAPSPLSSDGRSPSCKQLRGASPA